MCGVGWHANQFTEKQKIYRKTEFAECIGKQELSFLNSPAEFGMFVSLRGDLYSFIILRFSSGFNS